MFNLYLSGGGNSEDSKLLDKKFINSLPNKKIVYIPIALEGDKKHPYNKCLRWIKNTFSKLMNEKFEISLLTDLSGIDIDYLKSFDAIYIGGGNTYKLIQKIKKAGFDVILREFIKNYGPIYGGSAGAIIFGETIATVIEENDNNYPFNDGLNFLNNMSIVCHYEKSKNENILEFIKKYNQNVLALTERSGIIYSFGKIESVGFEAVKLFTKKGTVDLISPGKILNLKNKLI